KSFNEALAIDPKDPEALEYAGSCEYLMGSKQAAIKHLSAAGTINAKVRLAEVYASMGRTDEAEKLWSEAAESNPEILSPHIALGNMKVTSDPAKAIEHYDNALKADPKSDLAYFGKGLAYSNLNKHDEAIAAYKKAVELNPKNAAAYNNLGAETERKGNTAQAKTYYKAALDADPDNEDAKANYNRL
ncbi:MAG: tetratricopeptide repeat protein, partial [Abditibacteriota bacterium]|nr:tetratricopeptide repeat protein [Abditibacteriota bacterium]